MIWFTEAFVYHKGSWVASLCFSVHNCTVIHLKLNASTMYICQKVLALTSSLVYKFLSNQKYVKLRFYIMKLKACLFSSNTSVRNILSFNLLVHNLDEDQVQWVRKNCLGGCLPCSICDKLNFLEMFTRMIFSLPLSNCTCSAGRNSCNEREQAGNWQCAQTSGGSYRTTALPLVNSEVKPQ